MSDYEDSDCEVRGGRKRLKFNEYNCENDDDDVDDINNDDDIANGDGDCMVKEKLEIIPSKRPKLDNARAYNDNETKSGNKSVPQSLSKPQKRFGAKILEKLGHTHGKGLGKDEQGLVEPLKISNQEGKRGFGYHPEKIIEERICSEEEKISLDEKAAWLENPYPDELSEKELEKILVPREGPEKSHIGDETEFCNPEVLHNILEAKSSLDDIDVRTIRGRANPFETIRRGIFLNRAAMKMANMESTFDYMFTKPKNKNGEPIIGKYDLLYFADVCAGPGGFSEYVFYRKGWKAKGFGFTLKRENDFKLDEFFAGPCETFEPHYGVSIDGDTGDGDIFKTENIKEFSRFVMENTDGEGVHFMMADGGFSTDDKLIQEVASKQLYLCQCLVALKIVRTNGNFVVKLFDVFTPFSVGLIYLMYRSFDRISIHKPNTSRPANSERYLICQYKRDSTKIANFLTEINEVLCARNSTKIDVLELVPISVLKSDINFFEYIVESNTRIGERQVFHLKNIVYYAKHIDLCDSRQENFKEECLKRWDIPNVARTDPKKGEPNRKIEELFRSKNDRLEDDRSEDDRLEDDNRDFLYKKPKEVGDLNALKTFVGQNALDWYWMVVESGKEMGTLKFYLGLGRTNVYCLEGKRWCKVDKLNNFQLPDKTLIYGEIVEENVHNPNNLRGQYRVSAFHIVDGLFLGGEDIRHEHITVRKRYCEMFAKALSHSKIVYRVKQLYECNELEKVLSSSLQLRTLKNKKPVVGFSINNYRFIIPKGLLFLRGTKDDWCRYKSKSYSTYYLHNKRSNSSAWECDLSPDSREKEIQDLRRQIFADFRDCFNNLIICRPDENYFADMAKKEIVFSENRL